MEQTNLVLGEEELNHGNTSTPRKPRILIVEDDVTSQPLWEYILNRADKHVKSEWATSVLEAESKIDQAQLDGWKYDLIVSDIFLSGSKTGLDLWDRYHETYAGRVVLVSSLDYMKINKYMSGASKAPTYLKKPLVLEDCVELIYTLLHQKRF